MELAEATKLGIGLTGKAVERHPQSQDDRKNKAGREAVGELERAVLAVV